MKKYQCHKQVHAVKIEAIEFFVDGSAKVATSEGIIEARPRWRDRVPVATRSGDGDLGYYVRYEDGYDSWSPTKAFEKGKGIRGQIPWAIAWVCSRCTFKG
jgi:hypothetical protein